MEQGLLIDDSEESGYGTIVGPSEPDVAAEPALEQPEAKTVKKKKRESVKGSKGKGRAASVADE